MRFIADLHIHSRFSRATARNLDPENIYMAARKKGITVVGTGDFTHPGWFAELSEKLVPAEQGLFRLTTEIEAACEARLKLPVTRPVRFMLSAEISNIYKKHGATRKLHHLVFFSRLSDVERFNARLSGIGNITSDGRPILGLDSRNLLEIAMETAPDAFLIPAHIWTPWFSLYGSRSGFDSIKECFGDLSDHIFAAETGLSSDPPMNWRVPDLDGITLVSNSDAHNPANLGREANLFATDLSYDAMHRAMKTGDPEAFCGTVEFFPEEGKYHQDGHRKCRIRFSPRETREKNTLCPVCGQPLTLGVLHRVEALAGRPEGEKPTRTHPFHSLIPLAEVLAEMLGVGPKSKKVLGAYEKTLQTTGPELDILLSAPKDALAATGIPLLDEAILRMREGRVHLEPGYDGQYGRVTVFAPGEREDLAGQKNLFSIPDAALSPTCQAHASGGDPAADKTPEKTGRRSVKTGLNDFPPYPETGCKKDTSGEQDKHPAKGEDTILAGLNDAQAAAVIHPGGPLLIVAGPGTGKTRTLTCRIARILQEDGGNSRDMLAVTFTNKAAREMKTRLAAMLGEEASLPLVSTFHSLCFSMLREIEAAHDYGIADDSDRHAFVREAARQVKKDRKGLRINEAEAARCIAIAKQKLLLPEDDLRPVATQIDPQTLSLVYLRYREILKASGQYDYEDLVSKTVMHLRSSQRIRQHYQNRFSRVFIDEYQDLNYSQYCFVRLLVPGNGEICAIGDPDQSIYGFAGADAGFFQRFVEDYPSATVIRLHRNYRSTKSILEAAERVIAPFSIDTRRMPLCAAIASEEIRHPGGTAAFSGQNSVNWIKTRNEAHEAVAIGKMIEQMIGGLGFSYHDFQKEGHKHPAWASFSDFAVLYRTRTQAEILAETFDRAGIPYKRGDRQHFMGLAGIREIVCALKVMEGHGSCPDVARLLTWMVPGMGKKDLAALMSWGYESGYMANGMLAEAHRIEIKGVSRTGRSRMEEFLSMLSGVFSEINGLPVADKLERTVAAFFPDISGKGKKHEEAITYLMQTAAECGDNPAAFLEAIALRTDPDFTDADGEKVSLMTMHAAKGLEFPVVFIAGCEDGRIPFHSRKAETDMAEERRLFYVALTRAQKVLCLSCAESRTIIGGKSESLSPSPYLFELNGLIKETGPADAARPQARQTQLTLFS